MKRHFTRVFVVFLSAVLLGTTLPGTGTYESFAASGGKVKSVKVTNLPANTLTLKKGASKKLTVKVKVSGKVSKAVKFKSSNTGVAKVSGKGVVKAVKKGTAKITVTTVGKPKKKAVIKVTVGTPVKSVKLNKTKAKIKAGGTLRLKATVKPKKPSNRKLIWKSSNKKVAKVSSKGVVTGVAKGKATITAVAADGSGKKAKCVVTVQGTEKVKSVTVTNLPAKTLTLKKGTSKKLKVKVVVSGKTSKKVTFKSSNKKIVTVSNTGVVKALKKGKAKVTVASVAVPGKKTVITVTVGTPATSVAMNMTSTKLAKGGSVKLKATVKPKKASNKKVVWKTSNKKIATVSTAGVVKGIKVGKATITAVAADGSGKKATCTVNVMKADKPGTEKPKQTFTISFDSTGGSAVAAQQVKEGNYAKEPEAPVKEGFVFTGWFTDSACTDPYDFGRRVNASMTLYAGWSEESGGTEYTRGEWVKLLADMVQMNQTADASKIEYHFADTAENTNGITIETAYAYGIIPDDPPEDAEQDVPVFNPDQTATREFAAYTTARALGFEEPAGKDPSCGDVGELTYKNEVYFMISNDILRLRDGNFEPGAPVTGDDVTTIRAGVARIRDSETVDAGEEYDNSVYANKTLKDEFKSVTDYSITNNGKGTYTVTMTKSKATGKVTPGDTVILPATSKYPDGAAIKVTSAGVLGKKFIITGKSPELGEIFSVIDFAGRATAKTGQVTAAEGVSVKYNNNAASVSGLTVSTAGNVQAGGSYSMPGTLTFDADKKFSDNLKLKGSVEIEIPDVTCVLDADAGLFTGFQVNEFTLSMTEKVKIKSSLECKLAESGYELTNAAGNTRFQAGRIELGRVPFAIGATGLSVDLIFFVNVNAKAEVSITYTFVQTQGFQYKNGGPRIIKDFHDSLDLLEVKGSASVTLGAGLELAVSFTIFHGFDIVGVTIEAGPALEASFTPHVLATQSLYCADVHLYLTAKIALDQEALVGKFLKDVCHYTLEKELLKNDRNNPHRIGVHVENGRIVNSCTFGRSALSGKVVSASGGAAISGARVQIYSGAENGKLVRSKYTGSDGKYKIDNLEAGTYKIHISANGYRRYVINVTLGEDETKYVETAKMVDRTPGSGDLEISAVDSRTGDAIGEYDYFVRQGWNVTSGDAVASGHSSDSSKKLEVPAGNYTVQISKEGYTAGTRNVAVTVDGYAEAKVVMTNSSGGAGGNAPLTVILTWSDYPQDLDSHLYGPSVDSVDPFHTWFRNKAYYGGRENPIADLDLDDTDGYGPETTTVYETTSGQYEFYVHDYSNRGMTASEGLSESGAKVEVYVDNALVKEFYVPTGQIGTLWHVFSFDPATKKVKSVNTIVTDDSVIAGAENYEDEDDYDYDAYSRSEGSSNAKGSGKATSQKYSKIERDLIDSVRKAPAKKNAG